MTDVDRAEINVIRNEETGVVLRFEGDSDYTKFHKIIQDGVFTVFNEETGSTWRYTNGKLHHDTKPAIEFQNGMLAWYKEGFLHRNGGPAFIPPAALKVKEVKVLHQGVERKPHPDNLYWISGGWKKINAATQSDQYYLNGIKQRRSFSNE